MKLQDGVLFKKKRQHLPSEYTPDLDAFEWIVRWDEPDRGLFNLSLPLHPKNDYHQGALFKEGDKVKFRAVFYADVHESWDCAELVADSSAQAIDSTSITSKEK